MAEGKVLATLRFVKRYPITLCGFSLLFMPSVHRLLLYFSPLLLSTAIFIVAMASWGPRSLTSSSSGASSDEYSLSVLKDDQWSAGHGSSRSAGNDMNQTGNPVVGGDLMELELRRDKHANQVDEPDPDLLGEDRDDSGDQCEKENPKINGDSISFQGSPDVVDEDDQPTAAVAEKPAHNDQPSAEQHLQVLDTSPYLDGDEHTGTGGSQDEPAGIDRVHADTEMEEKDGHVHSHQTSSIKTALMQSNCERHPHATPAVESRTSSLSDVDHHRQSSAGSLITHHSLRVLQAAA